MKQHITIEQLNELSDKGKERLRAWWKPQAGDKVLWDEHEGFLNVDGEGYWNDISDPHFNSNYLFPLLSIGQMIEFLDEEGKFNDGVNGMVKERDKWGFNYDAYGDNFVMKERDELCEALWEAVKEVLEKE